MFKNRSFMAFLGIAAVSVGSLTSAAAVHGSTIKDDASPIVVSLKQPTAEFENVRDVSGDDLRVVDTARESVGEHSALLSANNSEFVLLHSYFSKMHREIKSDASEPGLDGWVEGENYFTNGSSQTDKVRRDMADLPRIPPDSVTLKSTTATSSTSFSAAWIDREGTDFEIFRDDVRIQVVHSAAFVDVGLQSGENYSYSVKSVASRSDQNVTLEFDVRTLPSNVKAVAKDSLNMISELAVQPTASWFMYDTFINEEYVHWNILQGAFGQCSGSIGDKYAGDDRGYKKPSLYQDPWDFTSHRTGARVKIDFGPNYVTEEKDVGPSFLYDSSGSLKETRTASTAGIVFSERNVSSGLYQVKISHEVGNPFCQTGAIRYVVYVDIWGSGVMQVNGYRHPVPAHEAYGLFMDSSGAEYWETMYRGAEGDFGCVSGLCATESISKTHTPG